MRENKSKEIFVLLTDTGTLFTKTIKKYTDAPYNHASLSLDKELINLYSFGRKNPRNPVYGGFVREDIFYGTYHHFPKTRCAIYKLNITEKQYFHIQKIIRYFEKNNKYFIYNIFGLFGVVVNYPIEIKNTYFCSQFVAFVLERAGLNLFDKNPALITPNDFRENEKLELIYEGLLYDYASEVTNSLLPFKREPFYKKLLFSSIRNKK